jgi:hypothetical protein
VIVVEAAQTRAPTCFIGLAIHGGESALKAFEAHLVAIGIRGDRVTGENPPEVMVFFVGESQSDSWNLYRDALSGKFGKLKVEVVVAPAAGAESGIKMDDKLTIEDPDFILDPST